MVFRSDSLLSWGRLSITKSEKGKKQMPGQNEEIKPYKDDYIWWSHVWKTIGQSTREGAIFNSE